MVENPDEPLVVRVSATRLRNHFNASDLYRQIDSGELLPDEQLDDRHLRNPELRRDPEPFCTRHQILRYLDPSNGAIILETSHFLHADGTLGASGKPDPKRMRVGNELWLASNN